MRYVGTEGKVVELEWDEELTLAMFNDYLDCGWGILDAVNALKNQGRRHSDTFWNWLTK